eukprot:53926-Heterocapsa_arctica.AAC.1
MGPPKDWVVGDYTPAMYTSQGAVETWKQVQEGDMKHAGPFLGEIILESFPNSSISRSTTMTDRTNISWATVGL